MLRMFLKSLLSNAIERAVVCPSMATDISSGVCSFGNDVIAFFAPAKL